MMMVKAGQAVDDLIEHLHPATWTGRRPHRRRQRRTTPNTERRTQYVESKGPALHRHRRLRRRRGALKGPSLMPGGSPRRLAARQADLSGHRRQGRPEERHPCCEWVGPRGAGHYVKMVHNGIEYGDMQLICEAYLMLQGGGRPVERRAVRRLRRVEPRRAGQLPDRDHPRHLQRQRRPGTATATWSTKSSTRPARKAPANG